jgi:hypothetical protein
MALMADTLHDLKAALDADRELTTIMHVAAGVKPPATEKEWLLYRCNENLRRWGRQRPIEWPETTEEDAERRVLEHLGINTQETLPAVTGGNN